MKRTSVLVIALALSGPAIGAEGDPLTREQWLMSAATRILALENHLHGDIGVADSDEGHIGESFEVNHAPGEACTFTMRKRNGPIVEQISFAKLSGEYRTSRRDRWQAEEVPRGSRDAAHR